MTDPNKKRLDTAGMFLCDHCQQPVSGNGYIEYEIEEEFVEETNVLHQACVKAREAARRGLVHPCPKCKATGKQSIETLKLWTQENGDLRMVSTVAMERTPSRYTTGKFEDIKELSRPCSLCDGQGYLAKEPIPVITEWRKAP